MKARPIQIKPMKLSVRKMRANNLNNFDLSNMPDDVQINADGDVPPAAVTTATTKPKLSLENIQKGIDTVNAAANIARSVQIRKADEVCGKRPLITIGKAGQAKLKAYNDCMAGKGISAPVDSYMPDTTPPPVEDDGKIMGMPKPLFFGILGVFLLGGGFLAYRKFRK